MSDSNNKNNKNPQSVGDFLCFAKKQLNQFDHPLLEAEMLMSFVTEKNRSWIKIHDKDELSTQQAESFLNSVQKRTKNIPLAYITGYKIWNELKIEVSADTLIPRDETEILAHNIVNNSRDFTVKSIADIGTGSGCLAIFLAKQFPAASVTAIDISAKALDIAQKNAHTHDVNIRFIESDLLTEIPREHYDIIVANLPYVPTDIAITKDVEKEPYGAIFSGTDGLDAIGALSHQLKKYDVTFGELWLEFWTPQEVAIATLFNDYKVEFYPDLSGDTYFAKITNK